MTHHYMICYIRRRGGSAICQKESEGRSADCKKCNIPQKYKGREEQEFTYTAWTGNLRNRNLEKLSTGGTL